MYRRAEQEDISNVMNIVNETVAEMKNSENQQWDEHYPLTEDFQKDIKEEALYLLEENHEIKGFIAVNREIPEEYNALQWGEGDFLVVHRLAVNPRNRQGGYATKLMKYAEHLASENNVPFIRSDTSVLNVGMNKVFSRLGYDMKGQINFHGKPFKFNCYEKRIQ